MPPVIELDRLVVRLGGRTILDGLTGTFSGRAIGLLGPNGAGKSTLINALLGFHPAASGAVRVFGADVREAKALRRLIGYMPENDAFISHMTGVRFVRYMAELAGLPSEAALERAHEAFFYVGLGEARYRKLGTYSLGMKQLAKLAQAIAHGPRLLLRDVEETCEEVVILKEGRIAAHCDLETERRSNRKFVELETAGSATSFTTAVQGLGAECAFYPNGHGLARVKVVLPDEVEMRELFRLA